MTVDPERLKVAMDAAREAYNENSDLDCNLTALNYALRAYDAALDAHDRQSKAPGDAAVARLAEIAKIIEEWQIGARSHTEKRIHALATRPLTDLSEHGQKKMTMELNTDETPLQWEFVNMFWDRRAAVYYCRLRRIEVEANQNDWHQETGSGATMQIAFKNAVAQAVGIAYTQNNGLGCNLTATPDPPPDTVPFTREMWELLRETAEWAGYSGPRDGMARAMGPLIDAAFPPEREGDSQ